MRSGLTAICALLVLATAGAAAAQDDTTTRTWAFGWDDGLTLRHRLGAWQVGLSAGPDDRLTESYVQRFDPALPDSLAGAVTGENDSRRESGFVRLSLARDLAAHRTLGLAALTGLAYSWGNESWDDRSYDRWDNDWDERRRLTEWDSWSVQLGARLAWRPVPFLALETEFGLSYHWYDSTTERRDRWAGDTAWTRVVTAGRDRVFADFGPYDLTSNVQILLWF
ncbi:MAG: hypothetical protein R6X35_01370 [Candidatus Krumholzibacteriia bacterium]